MHGPKGDRGNDEYNILYRHPLVVSFLCNATKATASVRTYAQDSMIDRPERLIDKTESR